MCVLLTIATRRRRALAEAHDNKSRAAEILKINRRLLYDKMQEFGID